MCLNREEVKKKMEELFPDFNFDEETSTLTANINIVEDKTDIEVNSQPLFTLTPEEVEIAKYIVSEYRSYSFYTKGSFEGSKNEEDSKKLLNKIEQWQYEHNK